MWLKLLFRLEPKVSRQRGVCLLMDCVGLTAPAIAAGVFAAWLVNWRGAPPTRDWSREALVSHDGCSCDEELRQLLKANSDLEWHRLFLLAAGTLLFCFLAVSVAVASALLGCCWPCVCLEAARGRRRNQRPHSVKVGPANRSNDDILAILAANEVRR